MATSAYVTVSSLMVIAHICLNIPRQDGVQATQQVHKLVSRPF